MTGMRFLPESPAPRRLPLFLLQVAAIAGLLAPAFTSHARGETANPLGKTLEMKRMR